MKKAKAFQMIVHTYRVMHRPMCLILLAGLAAGIPGCGRSGQENAPGGGPPAAMPGMPVASGPLEVGVLSLAASDVTLTRDLPGKVSAFRAAEVRARVDGIVQKRTYTEGSNVREGDVLYQIEPATYQALLNSAKATLAKAQASADFARTKLERYAIVLETNGISKQDYDDVEAALREAEAQVLSGKASVDSAQINLSYTQVVSPISGRIGKSQVTEGAYVQTSAATLMATVQQFDQVYVDMTQSSSEFMRLKRAVAAGEIQTDASGNARVKLFLDDGIEYATEGVLQFTDITVSSDTSSVIIRAIFPNPHNDLLPGMFVRARLVEGTKHDAIQVPQFAVTRNSKAEPIAYVVNDKGVIETRLVQTPRAIGNQWLVTSGLKPGEQLVVDSFQMIQDGMAVKAVPAKLASVYLPASNAR